MKKLLLLFISLPILSIAQQTYVPDDNFEAYLEANGMGNGIANDDYVTTANISGVAILNVNAYSISDLTGIEDFTALTELYCNSNQLTTLDVSNNNALIWLSCLDNQLTSLDVSDATALTYLTCSYNLLQCLNTKNGNWTNMSVNAISNNLTCVEVDNLVTAQGWLFDAFTTPSLNCNYPAGCFSTPTTIQENTNNINLYPNPTSDHVMIEVGSIPSQLVLMDIQGKVIREELITNKTHLMDISALDKGIYFVRIGEFSSKLIVE